LFFGLVLSQQFVEDAVKLLVTRFIPLNPADLENWMSDPEEWVNFEDKENEQWEYELRVRESGLRMLSLNSELGSALRRTRPHDAMLSI
jgi:hypothetical protein